MKCRIPRPCKLEALWRGGSSCDVEGSKEVLRRLLCDLVEREVFQRCNVSRRNREHGGLGVGRSLVASGGSFLGRKEGRVGFQQHGIDGG